MEQTYRIEKCDSKVRWDEWVLEHGGNPLQLWGWGDVKAHHGWAVERIFIVEEDKLIGALQLLSRKLPKPFKRLLYIPRGPVLADPTQSEAVYNELAAYVGREYTATVLVVEPDVGEPPVDSVWRASKSPILPRETVLLDLSRPEGIMYAEITPETRAKIKQSVEEGIHTERIITQEKAVECMDLLIEHATRQRTPMHKAKYYEDIYEKLGEHSVLLGAYDNERLVAFLWLAVSQTTALELFEGAVEGIEGEHAAALLRWDAVKRVKRWGIDAYDCNPKLTALQTVADDYSHKIYTHPQGFDLPLSPLYRLWTYAYKRRYRRLTS